MKKVVFDLEVFPEWWCMCYTNPDDITDIQVITSETDDYLTKLRKLVYGNLFVGFNIKGYDLRILNAIQHECDPYQVYECSMDIIEERDDGNNPYNNYYFWNRYNFTDLYDDWRYGTLKEFESNIGMSIKESDVPFGKENLTSYEKEEIIKYCKHDVEATIKLMDVRKEYLGAKEALSEMFKIPLTKAYKSTNAKLCAIVLEGKGNNMSLKYDYIIPEKVENYVRENVPQNIIDLFSVLTYKKASDSDVEEKTATLFENVIVYGVGGIHSTYGENLMVKTNSEWELVDWDVTSYYPNLMMNLGYMSRNAGKPEQYKNIYVLRRQLKKQMNEEEKLNGKTELWKKLKAQQEGLKLILNTTYGAMKNKYNALYDPYQASSLCYTGQLLLTALCNKVYNTLGENNVYVIQSNTDGVLFYVRKTHNDKLTELIHEWENTVGFTMEDDRMQMFFQRDVNNYIEVTNNPKKPYKLKGKWSNQAEETLANLNAPITHEAVLNYYTKGMSIEETINSCDDIIKFCFTAKTGRSYDKTYYYYNDEPRLTNKINRVVATTNMNCGTIKKYKSEEERFDKIAEIPEHCELMNDSLVMIDSLDRNWYIEFAKNKLEELKCVSGNW